MLAILFAKAHTSETVLFLKVCGLITENVTSYVSP
jgi:hypothetical protein